MHLLACVGGESKPDVLHGHGENRQNTTKGVLFEADNLLKM